jgi:hypothetical protein
MAFRLVSPGKENAAPSGACLGERRPTDPIPCHSLPNRRTWPCPRSWGRIRKGGTLFGLASSCRKGLRGTAQVRYLLDGRPVSGCRCHVDDHACLAASAGGPDLNHPWRSRVSGRSAVCNCCADAGFLRPAGWRSVGSTWPLRCPWFPRLPPRSVSAARFRSQQAAACHYSCACASDWRTSPCRGTRAAVRLRGSGGCGGGCVPVSGTGKRFRPPPSPVGLNLWRLNGSIMAVSAWLMLASRLGWLGNSCHSRLRDLRSLVRMDPHLLSGLSPPDSHKQGLQCKVRRHAERRGPADLELWCHDWSEAHGKGRVKRSMTTDRYRQPAWALMSVMPRALVRGSKADHGSPQALSDASSSNGRFRVFAAAAAGFPPCRPGLRL